MEGLPVAIRFARRELRGGLKGFRIFLACLALGVAAIAAVGSLAAAIVTGLERDGRIILGGDVELRLVLRPASSAERDWLAERAEVSEVVQTRAMAHAVANDKRTLVELKAVDSAYPLYGRTVLGDGGADALDLDTALAGRDGLQKQ